MAEEVGGDGNNFSALLVRSPDAPGQFLLIIGYWKPSVLLKPTSTYLFINLELDAHQHLYLIIFIFRVATL